MADLWRLLSDPDTQRTLIWASGGTLLAAGGLWVVIRFFAEGETPTLRTNRAGIAAGGKIAGSTITTNKETVIDQAARRVIQIEKQRAIRELRGTVRWEGDLDAWRRDDDGGPEKPAGM